MLLKAVIESVVDGILIVSPEGRMLHMNQNFLDIWKFPPHVLASREDEDALRWASEQTADPAGFLARVATVYENPHEPVREELRMKDGRVYERCGSPVYDGANNLGWLWTFRDITDRKRAEEAMRESQKRYRTLFDSIDEGFCVVEVIFDDRERAIDYRFLEVNPAFEKQTGLVDAQGKRISELDPSHEQHWFDFYGLIATSGQAARFENHAASMGRWFETFAFRVERPELRRVGVLFNDITKRKQALDALQASERFNRTVLESSPDCIKILDANGCLQFMNRNGMRLMEIDDFADYANQPWRTLWNESDWPLVQASVERAARGESAHFQACSITAKGTKKWWDVMVAPVAPGSTMDRAERLISVSRDITEGKWVEESLRLAKEQAESASRAKDNFLAALSHELRTPLTPVLLTASTLREETELPAHVREQLGMIERNIALEARLIDDLLDLTRITHGKLKLHPEECDAHSLIGLAVEIVRREARAKEIDIHLDLTARRSELNGDPARLQQVFWNLLRNAVKYTPPGGRIGIRSSNATSERGDSRLHISVSDSGIGLDAMAMERIFEPFEQASPAPEHRFGGLGLGLAIARAVVDLHQGVIRAESPGLGQGTTFTVEFPNAHLAPAGMVSRTQSVYRPQANEASQESPLRLLVVEDHEPTLQVLTRLLRRFGHTVTAAGCVADARSAAVTQRFDAVISDVGLPDGTGHELMGELRQQYGLQGIVVSGYGTEDDLRRSREAGFIAHLVKPVDVGEIRRALRLIASNSANGTT